MMADALPGQTEAGEHLRQTALRDFGPAPEDHERLGSSCKLTLSPYDAPDLSNTALSSRDSRFGLSQVSCRTSVAHHPTEDKRGPESGPEAPESPECV